MMGAKILFVDDDHELLQILSDEFSARGFEISLARSGQEFRTQVFKNKPQVIVLDIMLDQENGVDVYNQLLRQGFDPKVPVIFLSSLASDRIPSPAAPRRNYALRAKPIHMEELYQEIVCFVNAALA